MFLEDLRCHERKLVVDTAADNLGVDDESGGDVVWKPSARRLGRPSQPQLTKENETGISGEVEFRDADTTDGAVILVDISAWAVLGINRLFGFLPESARTIGPSRCPEHPWGGSGGGVQESTDAQSASGYACKPVDL